MENTYKTQTKAWHNCNTKKTTQQETTKIPGEYLMITDRMVLKDKYAHGNIDKARCAQECKELIYTLDKFSSHIIVTRIVQDGGKNYINCSIHIDYHTMIYQEKINNCHYCFMLSTRVECVVVVVVVCLELGKLEHITLEQVRDLNKAVSSFKDKYKLEDEMYNYTKLNTRRIDTYNNKNNPSNKAHSAHFHLKIFLSKPLTNCHLITMDLLNMTQLRTLEPIDYSFRSSRMTWANAINSIMQDIERINI